MHDDVGYNSCLKPFEVKQHLNNATRSHLASRISVVRLEKPVSNEPDWMKDMHFTQQIFLSLCFLILLYFALLKEKIHMPLLKH